MDGVQCKKCRYLLKNKDGYNWCPNKIDDPDVDLIRDCKWYAVKTNADRIHAMTIEELTERLHLFVCVHLFDSKVKCEDSGCGDCWRKWLNEEATDGQS